LIQKEFSFVLYCLAFIVNSITLSLEHKSSMCVCKVTTEIQWHVAFEERIFILHWFTDIISK